MAHKDVLQTAFQEQRAAEAEARRLHARWETEPYNAAREIAEEYLKDLREFFSGKKPNFVAYFMLQEGPHGLVHDQFLRGLDQLSKELEVNPFVINRENDVIRIPGGVLQCSYTAYADGSVCGAMYEGVRIDSEPSNTPLLVPQSAVLTREVAIQAVA